MPDPVDDLYGLPLDKFTAARNALAKELTRQGDKAKAAEVKKLPKPNRTAWALNQLVRQQPDDVETLLTVGEQLREAQQRALSGDAGGLRTATRAEQEQINRLVDVVRALAPGVHEDAVRATLRAAASDPPTGELLRRGRLVSDVETAGFGLEGLPDSFVIEAPPPRPRAPAPDPEERARREQEREGQRQARREAERLRREAELALRRAQRLREVAEEAEERAREARREAEAAAEAAEEAQRRAEDAAGRLTPEP